MYRSWTRWMAAGTLAVAATACENTPVELPEATTLVVPVTEITLTTGEEAGLTAQVVDQDGRVLPDARVSWTSSAPSVAIVFQDDGSGFVDAVSPGTAELMATYGSLTATVTVTVTQDTRNIVQSVEFMEESGSYDIAEGGVTLAFQAFDGYGELDCFGVDDGPFSITSSDESVAEIDNMNGCRIDVDLNGPGTATITLNVNGASDTYELTVTSVQDGAFFVGALPADAAAGETVSISVKAIDETGGPIAGQTINFDVDLGTLEATSVQTGDDGIATVEWTMPTNLRDFGLLSPEITFTTELPSGVVDGNSHSVNLTPDAATSLKLFHQVDAEYVEITDDAVTYETGTPRKVLAASYDQYGNLVEEDNDAWATAPVDVINSTGENTLNDGQLSTTSPYAEVESATEQTVTLTVEITTAEGEVLEESLEIEFVAPTP